MHSAYDGVLQAVFGDTWVGQERFTSTAVLTRMIAQLTLQPGAHILDVQCGTGGPATYIAHETGCTVVGIDADPCRIQQARVAAPQLHPVHFFVGTLVEPLFAEQSFDAIVARNTLYEMANRLRRITTYRRLLVPGGQLCSIELVRRTAMVTDRAPHPDTSNTLSIPTIDHYESMMASAGLELVGMVDTTDAFCEICARWFGALQVWDRELRQELDADSVAWLHATIGRMVNLGLQGAIGQVGFIATRAT